MSYWNNLLFLEEYERSSIQDNNEYIQSLDP